MRFDWFYIFKSNGWVTGKLVHKSYPISPNYVLKKSSDVLVNFCSSSPSSGFSHFISPLSDVQDADVNCLSSTKDAANSEILNILISLIMFLLLHPWHHNPASASDWAISVLGFSYYTFHFPLFR